MIKLFYYGTLCETDVQLREFGQEFFVEPELDHVIGWGIIKVKIDGQYYKVAIPDKDSSPIMGAIVHIPEAFMSLIDDYEGLEYKKVNIKTLSGVDCIMYVKR